MGDTFDVLLDCSPYLASDELLVTITLLGSGHEEGVLVRCQFA